MKPSMRFLIIPILLLISVNRLPAPIVEAPYTPKFAPKRQVIEKPKSKAATKPKPKSTPYQTQKDESKPKPNEATSNSASRFVGTWVATNSINTSAGHMSGIYTLVIRDGKSATKTLDTTNSTSAEKPFDNSATELRRKWTCDSTDLRADGASVTIQWSAGQLADWAPRSIQRDVIQSYGSPNAETSVYTSKGDELTRINDPNGVTYHRVK